MTSLRTWSSPHDAALDLGRAHRSIDVVTDPTVLALPPVRDLVATLAADADVRVTTVLRADVDNLTVHAGALRGDAIVAIGGGSVMDAAKIARYLRHGAPEALVAPQRSGLRALPDVPAGTPALVAVPTTVGTGAEASSGAVVVVKGRPVLARGLSLVPDRVHHCDAILAELPLSLRLRGAIEVTFRVLAPALEARGSRLLPGLVHRADQVLRAGSRLAAGEASAVSLRTIVEIGAETHGPWIHRGLYPFGSRVWYVTNELTRVLGATKLDVLPAVWLAALHLAEAGRITWMPSNRLADVQAALRLDGTGLSDAFARVFAHWGVPTRLDLAADQVRPVAETCLWRWGMGLPMLRQATRHDLELLLATAAAAPWSRPPVPARPEAVRIPALIAGRR